VHIKSLHIIIIIIIIIISHIMTKSSNSVMKQPLR